MTSQLRPIFGDATLTASGIARLAGVGRAAVSNWRRRYADFPAPVGGTAASPYFNAREVDEWLRRQGKLREAGAGDWAWRHIETYQPAAQLGQVLGIAGAYLLARAVHPVGTGALLSPHELTTRLHGIDRDLAEFVGGHLPDQWDAQLAAVLQSIDELAEEQEAEAAFEHLHSEYVSSAQSMSGLAATPDTVGGVMLTLAGSGARTFDFSCGTGSILRMAAERAFADGTTTHCYAQEIKPEYALIALIRLWFVQRRTQQSGRPAAPAPTLHVGDSLLADAFADLRADVVVANFPFGIHDWGHDELVYDPRWTYGLPPRTEPELAWVQHALAHLAPGGTAVVLMPPAAAARPAGRRIRAELVRRGTLRAVVGLPAGLMPPAGIGLQIWVLTEPEPDHEPDTQILFIDASAAERPAEMIELAWRAYRSGDQIDKPGMQRLVPAIELLDDRVDLTPQRHLRAHEQPRHAGEIITHITELNRLIAALGGGVPDVRLGEPTAAPITSRSLADLVRSGSMSVERIAAHAQVPSAETAVRQTGDDTTPPHAVAGDILLSMIGREIVARVVTPDQTSRGIPPGTHVMRVDRARFDPWFVAGALSRDGGHRAPGRTSAVGSGMSRIDLRRYTIPVLALPEQRTYGQLFERLAEFETSLDDAASLGAQVVREIRAGLAAGTLTPPV